MASKIVRLTLASLCALPVLATKIQPALAGEAATTAPSANAKEIDQLIAQLASPDEATRDQAREKLIGMGDSARSALEAQVRARSAAEAALQQIDTNKVAGGTPITLKVTDARPEAILAEISKQAGFEVVPYNETAWQGADLGTFSFSFDKKPFWEVLREVCQKANLSIYNNGNPDRRIMLMPGNMGGNSGFMKFPASTKGAFMTVVTTLQKNSSVDLSNPQVINRALSMNITVLAEPKVRIIQYSYQPDVEEAVDEKGTSLLAGGGGAGAGMRRSRFEGGMQNVRGSQVNMGVPLACPAEAGQKIARLKGKVRFIVQTRAETIEVADPLAAKSVSKTVGGRRFTLKEVKKINERAYQATVVFYREGMDQQAFSEMINNPTVKLLDADGKEITFNGTNGSTGSSNDQYEVKLQYYRRGKENGDNVDQGEPAKLVWEVTTGSQEVLIPFEFTDLPLP
ncbi:MAG TPA: hypothetical protein VIL86_15765 [Tepidisphaeraceae bacterium]|jgi:hypothetical protein